MPDINSDLALRRFHNAMRILLNLDRDEIETEGVINMLDAAADAKWERFRTDPFRFFIACDDATAEKLWAMIEKRQPKR
ncbi:MAG: hypothetical protein E6Q97_18745 [Desulfurellales bacterium]|nr:MAG: hypothetical protein E6Q97_18745 [Desulfurellales bacterium]